MRLLCSSDFAQITATSSAMEPEVIHIFSPLITYSVANSLAAVCRIPL